MAWNDAIENGECVFCYKKLKVISHVWREENCSPEEGCFSTWMVPYPQEVQEGIAAHDTIHGSYKKDCVCNECLSLVGEGWYKFYEELRDYRWQKMDYEESLAKMTKLPDKYRKIWEKRFK